MNTLSLWTRRDPFAEFDALVRHAFGPGARRSAPGAPAPFAPAAEIVRDGDDAVLRLEVPGVDVERDVTVEVDDGTLVVRGERRDERAEDADGRTLREVRYGAFRRAFRLPRHVGAEAVSATYDAGVLTVRVVGAHSGGGAARIAVTAAPAAVRAQAVEPAAADGTDAPAV